MLNAQKLRTLNYVLELGYEALQDMDREDMSSKELATLLENIGTMEWMADRFREEDTETVAPRPETNVPAVTPEQVHVTPTPVETVPEQVQDENLMSKEDVRDRLSVYSNKYDSLDVAAIMSDMGYSKLSEIPNTRYGELLKRVEESIKAGA